MFNFIGDYCHYGRNKTISVSLKKNIDHYSKTFIDGVLLGLALSDGHLKKRFKYNSISENLCNNVFNILIKKGFKPKRYLHDRSKWKWHDLHMISLGTKESELLLQEFNFILQNVGSNQKFQELKSGPAEI